MSKLHQVIYQSYYRQMHRFCQYPRLTEMLHREELSPQVRVLAIGKAAWKMASVCLASLQEQNVGWEGFVLTKYGMEHGPLPGMRILEAGHPLPDANGLAYSAMIVKWLKACPAQDDLLVLLSGGSSALFEMLPEDMSLHDLERFNQDLLSCGINIAEINRRRTEVSLLKGGKALTLAKARRVHVYAISDVEGNDPRIIGSGPFTPLESAQRTLDGWRFTLPGKKVRYHIVADNRLFCHQLAEELKEQGFKVHYDNEYQSCSLSRFTESVRDQLRRSVSGRRPKQPQLRIWGGEITIRVNGTGRGGRCSHLALSLAGTLGKYPNTALFCLATDGNDNLPGSGGSFVDSNSRANFRQAGLDYVRSREAFDSFTALNTIGNILPAPVLATNVNDVIVLSLGYDFDSPLAGADSGEYDIFEGAL